LLTLLLSFCAKKVTKEKAPNETAPSGSAAVLGKILKASQLASLTILQG